MPIGVRPAVESDLDDIARISVEAYDAAGQLDEGSPYRQTLADADARLRDGLLLVAHDDQRVVGTVTICPAGSPFSEIGRADEVEFRFLAVDPREWGRGIADALVAACHDHARTTRAKRLAICVRDTNVGAAAMYERRGFLRAPDRDWSPVPGVDLLALTREVE